MPRLSEVKKIDALVENDPATAKQYLSEGADPNAQLENGDSVLMAACLHRGQFDIVNSLVAHGASVDQIADDGLTALYVPADSEN